MTEERNPPEPFAEAVEAGAPGARSFVAEAVRKAVLTTVGALFLTEEGARKLAREWKLPKEVAAYLVAQAHGAKDEILRIVGQEVRRFLESEAFRGELKRMLSEMTVEVQAEVRLKESKGRPAARPQVHLRHRGRGGKDEEGGGG